MKVTITRNGTINEYTARRGQTILTFLKQQGITEIEAPCGGLGRCGKCKVEIAGQGEVLACKTLVADGMHIVLEKKAKTRIAERGICHNHYQPDGKAALCAACDIGTTTVVCHLIDAQNGELLATQSVPNAQKTYGADVVSRIERAGAGELDALHKAITGQIGRMLESLCAATQQK